MGHGVTCVRVEENDMWMEERKLGFFFFVNKNKEWWDMFKSITIDGGIIVKLLL